MERTLVLAKPDAVQRGLIGELVSRLERRGLKLVGMKLMRVSDATAREHYGEHVSKPFFKGLVDYITRCPVVAMVWEGPGAIEIVRATMGATNPAAAAPGTIRGDLAVTIGRNLIHGSDGADSAAREIKLFFSDGELLGYERTADGWIIEQ